MSTTEQPSFAADLVSLLGELEDVKRAQRANMGTYSYSYADLGDVESYVRPILARHRFGHTQQVYGEPGRVSVATELVHVSGETKVSPALAMRAPDNPQQVGSIITYLRRYSLLAALGLATEDDDGRAGVDASRAPATRPHDPSDETMPTQDQITRLQQLKAELHLTDRDVWLAKLSDVLGRTIRTTVDITREEATRVIGLMEIAHARDPWATSVAVADADDQLDAELLRKAAQPDDKGAPSDG